MEIKIGRDELLRVLEMAQPGLTHREAVEQSSSYVFRRGWVLTYNDEVSCRVKGPFPKDFEGVIQGKPLLNSVRLLPDDELTIRCKNGQLIIRDKRRQVKVNISDKVLLPLNAVGKPEEWFPVSQEFREALTLTAEAAGSDDSRFRFTCVHLTPTHIEASDLYRMTRVEVETPLTEDFLLKKDVVKALATQGVTEYSPGKEWCHFRNPEGLIVSCRKYLEPYPDLSGLVKLKGRKVRLPKIVIEATELAQVFSKENSDDDEVTVKLESGRVLIQGIGVNGEASQVAKAGYDGPAISFRVGPEMLARIVEKYNDCMVCDNGGKPVIRADGPNWVHITSLSATEKEETVQKDESKPYED